MHQLYLPIIALLSLHVFVVDSARFTSSMPQSQLASTQHGLRILGAQIFGCVLAGTSHATVANADLRGNVASLTSYLPGQGVPDIYYPAAWKGAWETRRNITSVEGSSPPPDFLYNYKQGSKRDYITVFDDHEGNIIKDRRLSILSEAAAYSIEDPKSIASDWEMSNPNVLTVTYANKGKSLVYQISKRSTEQAPPEQKEAFVGYSEFGRIIESDIESLRPPTVYSFRVLSRIKQVDENTILGLDRFYLYSPVPLDGSAAASDKPILTIKSQLKLTR